MSIFEVVFLATALLFSCAVLILPPRAVRARAATAVVGALALAGGMAVAWLSVRLVSPAGLLSGAILSAAGLHAVARSSGRARPVLIAFLVFATVAALFVRREPSAVRRSTAAELAEAVAARAEVRDFGRIRGVVWGDRPVEDMRAFAQGLEFSDLDFALAVGRRASPGTLSRLVERTAVPTIWIPVDDRDRLSPDEVMKDGVAVIRPAKHLILVAVDSRKGFAAMPLRDAVDAALATDGDPKRHLVLVMHTDPAELSEGDQAWLKERVEERGVDLVLTASANGSEARRVGEASYATLGPAREGFETLLRMEVDPRRLTINSIRRRMGERIPIAKSASATAVIVANGGSARDTLALLLAMVGLFALPMWPLARWSGGRNR